MAVLKSSIVKAVSCIIGVNFIPDGQGYLSEVHQANGWDASNLQASSFFQNNKKWQLKSCLTESVLKCEMGFKSGTAFLWGVKEPQNTGRESPSKVRTAAFSSVYENWLSLNNTWKDYDVCAAEEWVAKALHNHLSRKSFSELFK